MKIITKEMDKCIKSLKSVVEDESSILVNYALNRNDKSFEVFGGISVMELADLLVNGYEVEKTIEEKLKEKKVEYLTNAVINGDEYFKLEGFVEALKIMGCDYKWL